MNKRILFITFLAFLTFVNAAAPSQSLSISFFNSADYRRSSLFAVQDQIYDRNVSYNQGLELICRQDKVKAEISGLGSYYTPLDLDNIPPGDYRVQLSKTGYYPYQFSITIKSNSRSSVEVDLRPYLTKLNITGLPPEATVYINNRKIEGITAEVSPGEISLRIRAFGYEDFFKILSIGTEAEQTFTPQLMPREFGIASIETDRRSIWLGDSPSQKKFRFTVRSTTQGTGAYRIIRGKDNSIIQQGDLSLETEKTFITLDLKDISPDETGDYRLEVTGSDGDREDSKALEFSVFLGSRSRWRNSLAGSAGFLYCPDALTLPAGISQIQTGFNPSFTSRSIDDLYIPAFLSLRTAINDRIEITAGTALYISPEINNSSLDIQISGKFLILGHGNGRGFAISAALAANYNGISGDFGAVPPFDPYSGVSGLSLSVPIRYGSGIFSFVFAPEFRISPSYPMMSPGGFSEGELYIWNYFKGAAAIDAGPFTAALSAALQTPSYLHGGEDWPIYYGLDVSITPGTTGFTLSLFGGFRYLSGEDLLGTAGMSAGFLW
ncbi:MAG: PEGA domain-containing protein [Spirochaetales bacterium]|nr:PEGA domain-containing protein [Spirochaetales bacterium]